jgi:hypothetical protein
VHYFDLASYTEQRTIISHQCFEHVRLLLVRTLPNPFLAADLELSTDDQTWAVFGDYLRIKLAQFHGRNVLP